MAKARKSRARPYLVEILLLAGFAMVIVGVQTLQSPPQWLSDLSREWRYSGSSFACNICGRTLRNFERSASTQNELQCPFCLSRPRHRTAYRWFQERSDLFDGRPKRMLHIAPEPSLRPKFQAIQNLDYLSGDLNPAVAMVRMDITDIQYPDNSFDVIYCSHVLEHVPDDRKAMREFARVLKPGGWAVIAVPILRSDKTFEDSSITAPEDRERMFGQWDHVRMYGPDFADRLTEAGFEVTIDRFAREFTEEDVRRYGLSREDIYVSRRSPGAALR